MTAPLSSTTLATSDSSRFVLRVMVVFTWNDRPTSFAVSNAATVRSNVPSKPRNESCVSAVAPSSEKETRRTPMSTSFARRSCVTRAVAEGDKETVSPFLTPYSAISKMSRLINGSPPESTTIGGVSNSVKSSMTRSAASVSSSRGCRFGCACARQCSHLNAQARVTSQKITTGS